MTLSLYGSILYCSLNVKEDMHVQVIIRFFNVPVYSNLYTSVMHYWYFILLQILALCKIILKVQVIGT